MGWVCRGVGLSLGVGLSWVGFVWGGFVLGEFVVERVCRWGGIVVGSRRGYRISVRGWGARFFRNFFQELGTKLKKKGTKVT